MEKEVEVAEVEGEVVKVWEVVQVVEVMGKEEKIKVIESKMVGEEAVVVVAAAVDEMVKVMDGVEEVVVGAVEEAVVREVEEVEVAAVVVGVEVVEQGVEVGDGEEVVGEAVTRVVVGLGDVEAEENQVFQKPITMVRLKKSVLSMGKGV